jgi:NitT/TauT family transport system substrate-binding protein
VAALKKRKFIIIAVVILVIAIVLSSFVYLNFQKPYAGPIESIILGTTFLESVSPGFVAEDQQFFTKNGLNVTLKYYDVGLNAVIALEKGEVDMAWCAEYILVGQALGNQNIQTIGSVAKTDFASIVARKDRGIENISDLYGKKIGVVRGTVMEFYLGRFLELNGLTISEVTLVNITLAQSANMVINGDVDAVVSFPPYVETARQQLGGNAVVWAVQGKQMLYGLITCRADWLPNNHELVKRFLKSMSQTEDYMVQHPNEAKAIVQKKMNYTDDYMATVWARNDFSLSLDQSLVVAMENEARWMIKNNLTERKPVPDFLNYIYVEGLNSVKPESLDIIG